MKRFRLIETALLACLACRLGAAQVGEPLDNWRQLNPDADLYGVVDAKFAKGRWVAITKRGRILNSLDGINWARSDYAETNGYGMRALQWSGSRWIAVSGDHMLLTSEDGLAWKLVPDVRFPLISYGNDRWVAFRNPSQNDPPALFWSTNGIAWNYATATFDLHSLVFGSGQWLALGVSGLISSTDGEHWLRRSLPEEMGFPRSLAQGNGVWLITSCPAENCTNVFRKSLDGLNWEKVVHDGGAIDWISFGHQATGGLWFGQRNGSICTSTNLSHWDYTSSPVAGAGGETPVWVGGRWVMSSTWVNHEVFMSTNGLDWLSATAAVPTRAISYGQGKWLGINNRNQLLCSTNGRRWTVMETFSAEKLATDLDFADGLWVLGGMVQDTNVFLLTSADGTTWNSASILGSPTGFVYLRNIRHTSEGWTALTYSDWLLRSSDGRNWTWSQGKDSGDPEWVGFSGGSWVAVPQPWLCGMQVSRREIVSEGLWVGIRAPHCSQEVLNESSLVTSSDGKTWTDHYVGPGVSDFTLSNGCLIVISVTGSIVGSDPLLSLEQNRPGNLTIRRAAGIPVIVESSDDLRQWHTLTNLPLGDAVQKFADPTAKSSTAQFYRARTP